MGMNYIDAGMLKNAFLAGAKGLEANKEWINELNVFPVPDGDTGTNMTMTILSAAREVAAVENPTMEALARAISSGSLRGARGNSGVILSQLFRGFTKEIKTVDVITTSVLSDAFNRATETAYKAVMKPKEGTILTVAKGMADKAAELAPQTEDVLEFSKKVLEHGEYVLSQTPEMLPVLKEAGVVDSGGQGLIQVIKGCIEGLKGKVVDIDAAVTPSVSGNRAAKTATGAGSTQAADIRFGYCTEFIINAEKPADETTEQELKDYLSTIGDSLVVVADDDIVKIHVHTNDPGLAIQKALTYGSLSRIKIDNMREEHQEKLIKDSERLAAQQKAEEEAKEKKEEPRKKYGFIAVSVGEGLSEIFKGIGADYIIEGGQTMNPSTEDMLEAIEKVHAETVYILPNNKNIIMAAEQTVNLADRGVSVVATKTVPQGITAMLNFDESLSSEENHLNMAKAAESVHTAQVTFAARDSVFGGQKIKEGQYLGMEDGKITLVEDDLVNAAYRVTRRLVKKFGGSLITVFYGEEADENSANVLSARLQERFPNVEVNVINGGQPVYYFISSVE